MVTRGSWEQVVEAGEMTVVIFFSIPKLPGGAWGNVTLTDPWCPGDTHGAPGARTPAPGQEH